MNEVRVLQPSGREELVSALSELTEESVVLSGGTDLVIRLRETGREPDLILSLKKMEELSEIKMEKTTQGKEHAGAAQEMLCIGAMCTHGQISKDSLVQKYFPALSMACAHVGSAQIRNKGTIGGNLANASPAGDTLPVLYLFHGMVDILNPSGEMRRISVEELVVGSGRTSLLKQEIIHSVLLPVRKGRKSIFCKLGGRKEVTIADLSLCLSWEERKGRIYEAEGILGAVDIKPVALPEAGELLEGLPVKEAGNAADALAENLAVRIRLIREKRSRPPKLRITEAEQLYKERAVRGIVGDVLECMAGGRSG